MGKSRDNIALEWTLPELIEVLTSARRALDAQGENLESASPSPMPALDPAVEALHQVHGTLVMLELPAAAAFAASMEELARQLCSGEQAQVAQAAETLMRALLELPEYLEESREGAADSALPLLPLHNELRALLGQPPLAAPLVALDFSRPAGAAALERFRNIDGLDKARKLRAIYQQMLLSVLKGAPAGPALAALRKVALSLQRLTEDTPQLILWQAFEAFLDVLQEDLGRDPGPLGGDVVKLLRRVDSELRALGQAGEQVLTRPAPQEVLRQLVDLVSVRGAGHAFFVELSAALDASAASDGGSSTGRRALATAAAALRDDLSAIRDRLDLLIRIGQPADRDSLEMLVGSLKQVTSTMSVLGLESSRAIVAAELEAIREAGPADPESGALEAIAAALEQVDENLAGLTQAGKAEAALISDAAQLAVLHEARQGLERLKQAVVDFVSAHWDVRHLQELPEQLEAITGALRILPLHRAAELVERCRGYVTGALLAGHVPDWEDLDRFAGAVSGIDYYLERLEGPVAAGADDILEYAERSLDALKPFEPVAEPGVTDPAQQCAAEIESVAIAPEDFMALPAEVVPLEMSPGEGTAAEPIAEAVPEADPEAVPETVPEAAPWHPRLAGVQDSFAVDPDIVEVFVEEVDEVLAAIDAHLHPWLANLSEGQHAPELRRAFHTLKGSGRMVGAHTLGELAWGIEQMLNRVIDGSIEVSRPILEVTLEARNAIPVLRQAFIEQRGTAGAELSAILELAETLATGGSPPELEPVQPDVPEAPTAATFEVVAEPALQTAAEPTLEATEPVSEANLLFCDEAEGYLAVFAAAWPRPGCLEVNDRLVRALHTLTGSAAMVGLSGTADLARAAMSLAQALLGSRMQVSVEGDPAAYLATALESLQGDLAALRDGNEPATHPDLVVEAERLRLETPTAALNAALLALPGLEVLLAARKLLDAWLEGDVNREAAAALRAAVAELSAFGVAVEFEPLSELSAALAAAHERLIDAPTLPPDHHARLCQAHEHLLTQIDALVSGQSVQPAPDLVAVLQAVAAPPVALEEPEAERDVEAGAAEGADAELLQIFLEEAEELLEDMDQAVQAGLGSTDSQPAIEALLRSLHTLKGGARLAGLVTIGDAAHDFESWLLAVRDGAGLDPAAVSELLGRHDRLVAQIAELSGGRVAAAWTAQPTDESVAPIEAPVPLEPAAAGLVTVEDPALPELPPEPEVPGEPAELEDPRVAEAPTIVEAPLIAVEPARAEEPTLVEAPEHLPEVPPGQPPASEGEVATRTIPLAESAGAAAAPDLSRPEIPESRPPIPAESPQAPQRSALKSGPDSRGAEEVVRVRAALLDQLVNLAGESSIVRARAQQGLSEFGAALEEMESTIERLRDQLRRLEIETEAQILFRHEGPDGPAYEEFDPLELDRYSQLQQLSRSLSESASDMLDLKETLRQRVGETDALLTQQARINTELQEGLMRSRMVPFARLLPRLQRTVRQVARELGKSVELDAYDVEGELDRNLLDRMIAPLEHMLRNAIDHGVEPPERRRALGKPEAGTISLRLLREGGDVLIDIRDDGAGIDVDRVRAKARERGLLADDAELDDAQLQEFIFAPGFSTAASVTQISGRGVGMDVVYSEVKALGGAISVASEPGRGTRFEVRVPFTVSVNRALMVVVGEDLYALPLNTIEGIVLIGPDELEPLSASFEYAGVRYEVRHLGEYLGHPGPPVATSSAAPVVLVRTGELAVAVQVDAVQGSREIVVKGLGPLLAGVTGVSGATILGDGSVVVILDLLALVRARQAVKVGARQRVSVGGEHRRTVLVVDDSVTVRKVTSRLLERQGAEVMVAKDGVEAVALLQERKPDIMLLDIEMPRMDGFEVLRHVRHDVRLADLPVVMISSRTGVKHQERARDLGVNRFLGKPFQEAELLETIDNLLS